MARGIPWAGANRQLGPPEGMDESQVDSLHVFPNGKQCVSCWQFDAEELAEIARTGCVFVSVWFGDTQPPIYIGSEANVRQLCADYGVWKA